MTRDKKRGFRSFKTSHTGFGGAVTTWNYHLQRGWLTSKRDNNDKGTDYDYWPSGRLRTRDWARTLPSTTTRLRTSYTYNSAGDLETITYNDDATAFPTPPVAQTYDRLGRLETTADAAGLLTRSYDPTSGQLAGEAYSGTGLLAGRALARTYDGKHRPQSLATNTGYGLSYDYDPVGRLDTVSQGFHSAIFGYEAGTSAHNRTIIKRVGVERVRHDRVYDGLGRVKLARSIIGGTPRVQRDYGFNSANQRTGVEMEDGRRWAYGYDNLGQVTSAQKRLADNATPLPGYTFGYTFDDIGNRSQTVINGNTTSYTPDLLNRYESREVAGAVAVRGEAHADATVTVDTLSPTRTGKDFYREMPFTNTSASVSDTVTVAAVRTGPPLESASEERSIFVPKTPEVFAHDDDGDLIGDGRWTYRYDAENRLVSVETPSALATAFPALKKRLSFAYDAQSRRIRKHVETWDAALNGGLGNWLIANDLRFLYVGYNLICELDALNGYILVRSHAWGLDLSGSLQGAGGVGGLLWTNTPTHTFAASSDANGNVTAYINTATLAVSGRADYGAFGESVARTGITNALPFGFSSKYNDMETGLIMYPHRAYQPSTGRWLNRDPIEEKGGLNLYGMIGNDAVNYFDPFGLERQGHHQVSQRLWVGFSEQVRSVWDDVEARIQHPFYDLHDGKRYANITAKLYSDQVAAELKLFMKRLGILNPCDMTPKQARDFLYRIKNTNNPIIKSYNMAVDEERLKRIVEVSEVMLPLKKLGTAVTALALVSAFQSMTPGAAEKFITGMRKTMAEKNVEKFILSYTETVREFAPAVSDSAIGYYANLKIAQDIYKITHR